MVTEGELMTEEEAEEWLQNSIKTLRVLSESDPEVSRRLYAGFVADVRYLVSLGKMGVETIAFVEKRENLSWQND
jgi:glucose-6-phosphate dehydrogenase assembly protein OpcA